MVLGQRVVVVLPAFNAEGTLEMTVRAIPAGVADEILLVDDSSTDRTVAVARALGIRLIVHDRNRGYGANQKTCYREALRLGADIVVMLHPDYQYEPRLVPAMAGMIAYGLTGGMKMNAIVYLTSTHLGARSFGLFYGVISITTTMAMGIGPLIANHIYDVSQSYTPVIWATVPGFIAAGMLFALLGPAPDFAGRRPEA